MRTLCNAITPSLQRGSLSTSNLPRPTRRTLFLLVACVFFMYRTTRNNGLVYDTLKTLDQMFNQPRTQTQSTTGNSDEKVRDNVHNNTKITTGKTEPVEKYSSIQYNQTEKQLLQTFSLLTLSFQKISSLSPREIADKYDLPETSRLVECNPSGTTQIGWISKVNSNATSVDTDTTSSTAAPIIPPLIFQSWKTNHLSYKCVNMFSHGAG